MAIALRAAPSQEPLRKGLIKGGVSEFNLITLNGGEKKMLNSMIYFSFLTSSQLITLPKE